MSSSQLRIRRTKAKASLLRGPELVASMHENAVVNQLQGQSPSIALPSVDTLAYYMVNERRTVVLNVVSRER